MSEALTSYFMLKCRKCNVTENHGKRKMFKCGKCVKNKNPDPAVYCSRACQKADWEDGHKGKCKNVPPEVVAARARSADGHDWCQDWRKCDDGSLHFGDLELITWDGVDSDGEQELGFGGYPRHHSADIKRMFEVEAGGDKLKFFKDNDDSFRWTCCGLIASNGKRCLKMSSSNCSESNHALTVLLLLMVFFLQQVYPAVITTEIQKLRCRAVATSVKWGNLLLLTS
jgi:hypothetical protein